MGLGFRVCGLDGWCKRQFEIWSPVHWGYMGVINIGLRYDFLRSGICTCRFMVLRGEGFAGLIV